MNHDELDHYIETQTTILRGEEATDELFHFGIKGMKWGVRRYQNADGSLTPAGEKRYYGKAKAIQKDIDSFKAHRKTGILSKSGKVRVSKKEVNDIIRGLKDVQAKAYAKGNKKRKSEYGQMKMENAPLKERMKMLYPGKHDSAITSGLGFAGLALGKYGGYKLGRKMGLDPYYSILLSQVAGTAAGVGAIKANQYRLRKKYKKW